MPFKVCGYKDFLNSGVATVAKPKSASEDN